MHIHIDDEAQPVPVPGGSVLGSWTSGKSEGRRKRERPGNLRILVNKSLQVVFEMEYWHSFALICTR